jgi:hypothetical protein
VPAQMLVGQRKMVCPGWELFPVVVDALGEEGGVPSRLLRTGAGDDRLEGTLWRMFAGSLSGRVARTGLRSVVSRARVRVG